jgi:hypothetical protein
MSYITSPTFLSAFQERKKWWMITWGIIIGNLQVNRFEPLVNYHCFLQFASGFVELPLKNGDFPMFSLYVYQREHSMGVFRNAVAFWPWPGLKKIHHQSLI